MVRYQEPVGIWASSNPGVATVDANGLVTGVSAGMTEISYSYSLGSCTVVRTAIVNVGTTSIVTGTVSTPFCAGSNVNVPYTISGTFNASNTFTAQLSDDSGSFASPVNIGSLTNTTTNGTIVATIPGGTSDGNGYRIRVIGNDPVTTGFDNTSDLTIGVTFCPTNPSPVNTSTAQSVGSVLSWTASAGATAYDVYFGTPTAVLVSSDQAGTTYNPGTLINSTTYQWYVIPKNICGANASCNTAWSFTTAPPEIFTSAIVGSPFTAPASVNVPFTITGVFTAGNTFTAQLSDINGSFSSPTNIGSIIGTTNGTINANIPEDAYTGTKYRIRVIGNGPATVGADNGADLVID